MEHVPPNGIVTLTTDFGTLDGYVGAMKGVLLERFPDAQVVDLTHDIPAQDVHAGARALANACRFFPAGTVHVAVIDPGVGTGRAAIVVEHRAQIWVAPDNGVVSRAVPEGAPAWRIQREDLALAKVSRTFHGRDVFAPAAAALAAGRVGPSEVGEPLRPIRLPAPTLQRGPSYVRGEIVAVDRFGNLVTNIPLDALPRSVDLGSIRIHAGDDLLVDGISWSYADVDVGEWVAVIGSGDTVEISVREGNAADRSRRKIGDPVRAAVAG